MQEISTGLAFLYLIRYICKMELKDHIRELYFSDEFWGFYNKQQEKVKCKFNYVLGILRTERVVSAKFVKHLQNTDLYEMRVSVGSNEYRTVLFAMGADNIVLSTQILVLNAFLKKSAKEYKKQIEVAEKILGGYIHDTF